MYTLEEELKLLNRVKGLDDFNELTKIHIEPNIVFHKYQGYSKKLNKKVYKRKNKMIKKSRKINRKNNKRKRRN